MQKRITITFEPDVDVLSLLKKASSRRKGITRTFFINESIRRHFAAMAGKREGFTQPA